MKLVRLNSLMLAILFFATPLISEAQNLTVERVASGLSSPIFATHAPGEPDKLFIAQRSGAIRILDLNTGNINGQNFMTVPSVNTSFEGGFLGLAFHPDYENNGFFYVNYTTSTGGGFRTRIARFTRIDSNTADAGSLVVLLEVSQPQQNHNAGWIGFGPDNLLYIAVGDGGGGNDSGSGHTAGTGNGQDITNNLLGKMLRIDVDGDDFPGDANLNYSIPAGNPFVGVTGDDEIFVYGMRNPFRCSFDRDTGDLYIGDVGQGAREEIDVIPAGNTSVVNMGWRLREGIIQTPGVGGAQPGDGTNPIYNYPRSGLFGGTSVTGGVVYRGPAPGLQGNYFFTDFNSNNLWSLRYDGSDPTTFNGNNHSALTRWNGLISLDAGTINSIVAFGEDTAGNVYLVDLGGEVFKIVDGSLTTSGTLDLVIPFVGTFDSGSPANLDDSDDVTLKYRNVSVAPGAAAMQIEFRGTISTTAPSVLFFNYEGHASTPNLTQTIEIFNFLTGSYEEFDTRDAATSDEAVSVEISVDAAQYAGASGDVQARVTLTVNGPVTASPWAIIMDQAGWEFIE